MGKQNDDRLGEVLRAARRAPRDGWQERALAAMAAAGREREVSRLGWVPRAVGAVLVVAALAFVPYSASGPSGAMGGALAIQQAAAAEALRAVERPRGEEERARRRALPEYLTPYAERAVRFVRERYPDDPEMLMAAGLLTRDMKEALALLEEAAERSPGGAAWAAYAGLMMGTGPRYTRAETEALGDEGEPEALAKARRRIAEAGRSERLSAEQAAPAMAVLRRWQEVEPENGVPVALEVYYLYGLHRDADALRRWEEASRLPEMSSHGQEIICAVMRLISEMGMPVWQMGMPMWSSAVATYSSARVSGNMARLREATRTGTGLHEGRLVQLEGREQEAVRWWEATVGVGRGMQESAGTLLEYLIGAAIEGVGASPVWVWRPDVETGIPGGPLQSGRLFQGPHYDFYVKEAGSEAAEDICDGLLLSKVRVGLFREYARGTGGLVEEAMKPLLLGGFSMLSGVLLAAFLVVFGAVSLWGRRGADEATRLGWRGGVAVAVLALLPALTVGVVTWVGMKARASFQPAWGVIFFGGIALSLVGMIVVPLIAARWSRRSGEGLVRVWRGNLRKVLPAAMVLCAVISLGLGLAGRRTAAEWARCWQAEGEMERLVRVIGPEWSEPTIPEDAWRAEPPPRVEG